MFKFRRIQKFHLLQNFHVYPRLRGERAPQVPPLDLPLAGDDERLS